MPVYIVYLLTLCYCSGVLAAASGDMVGLHEQVVLLQQYDRTPTAKIVTTIANDLLSDNAMIQDAGCIILYTTLDHYKKGDDKAVAVFDQLAKNSDVVCCAADIIDSKLLGWYTNQPPDTNDDARIYVPLFHLLGRADEKTARGTLVRSFLYLNGRMDILEGVLLDENIIGISVRRLSTINAGSCCLYPGREPVAALLDITTRTTMLEIFFRALSAQNDISIKSKQVIKSFTTDCLEYGDAKNGHRIRIKAIVLAGLLIKMGETDLKRNIEALELHDPYFIHNPDPANGYSITEIRYPVRDAAAKYLHR